MTRGFVTIATGNEQYYRIARNLLRSYRLFSPKPLPFALICDRENAYTREFDSVVRLGKAHQSYVDKLQLPRYIPFDETIFIDADCLALADLNALWEAFSEADFFSAFGNELQADNRYGWFQRAYAGKYAERIECIPEFIGGVYYLRKCAALDDFDRTCHEIVESYRDFRFRQFADVADEPVYALAMAVHHQRTAGARSLPVCFYPHANAFWMDLPRRFVRYDNCWNPEAGIQEGAVLVHWGSGNTRRPCYRMEEYKLLRLSEGKALHRSGLAAAWLRFHGRALAGRLRRGVRKALNR